MKLHENAQLQSNALDIPVYIWKHFTHSLFECVHIIKTLWILLSYQDI